METKLATDIFDDWAIRGKDKGMEKGHSIPVDRMIEIAYGKVLNRDDNISILDFGCGNGWMLRKILSGSNRFKGLGVDGAISMIENAKEIDPSGNYICSNLASWQSSEKFDLIISMEVIYYLDKPKDFIASLFNQSLNKDGVMIIGMDHYKENARSLSWPKDLNVQMNTLSINEWVDLFVSVGFSDIQYEQYNEGDNWSGTLIITASK